MDNSQNKNKSSVSRKGHGQILSEIAHEMRSYMEQNPDAVYVREQAQAMLGRSARTLQTLHKVVGVSDLYAWAFGGKVFEELNPRTIKKILTDDPNADKETVAASLVPYVGQQTYACDDESDAVAVGIAWLIQNDYVKKFSGK